MCLSLLVLIGGQKSVHNVNLFLSDKIRVRITGRYVAVTVNVG